MSRCHICNKKCGICGWDCKWCHEKFCNAHRLPESHDCKNIEEYKACLKENYIKAMNNQQSEHNHNYVRMC
jgi:predicted nucleic acid binding AN1-type Zn finger protein